MISKPPAAIATAPINLELINVASVMSPRTTSPATIKMIPSRIRTQVVGADTLTVILDPFSGALMFRSAHVQERSRHRLFGPADSTMPWRDDGSGMYEI